MSLADHTARTPLGAVDLVPFFRRDAGITGVELREWEREGAAVALHGLGWHTARVAHAVGMNAGDVADLLAGRSPRRSVPATHCKNDHEFTEANTSWAQGRRQCVQCRRDRDKARREMGKR